MITQTARTLTLMYRDNSLPAGDYYFMIAGSKPQISRYIRPTTAECLHRSQNSLPRPQARFVSGEQSFIGSLKTLIVLAEVPPYQPQQEQLETTPSVTASAARQSAQSAGESK